MASAFMGYVLPWGQMSFWGCTVITNLLSAVPGLVPWICGGFWQLSMVLLQKSNNTDAKGSKRVKIRCQGSIIYTSSNQAIAISKSNNPLNMCLFIILFNYWIAILSISDVSGLIS